MQQYKVLKRVFLKSAYFSLYRNYKNKRQQQDADLFNVSVVLFDNACPLCRAEMLRLKRFDRHARLVLLDINSPAFNPDTWGIDYADAARALHVLTPDNEWLVAMPAIRHIYERVGLGWLMAPTRWPLFSSLADRAYQWIAPNRQVLSRWLGLQAVASHCGQQTCTPVTTKRGQ